MAEAPLLSAAGTALRRLNGAGAAPRALAWLSPHPEAPSVQPEAPNVKASPGPQAPEQLVGLHAASLPACPAPAAAGNGERFRRERPLPWQRRRGPAWRLVAMATARAGLARPQRARQRPRRWQRLSRQHGGGEGGFLPPVPPSAPFQPCCSPAVRKGADGTVLLLPCAQPLRLILYFY